MIVRLIERDAGPLPRGKEPEPARRAPVRTAGGSAIGRTLPSSRPVAAPTPYRRPGDENDLPLTSIASLLPSSSDNQPARTAISTLTDRETSRFDRIQTAHPARYTI